MERKICWLALFFCLAGPSFAETQFRLGFEPEAAASGGVIYGQAGTKVQLQVYANLSQSVYEPRSGASGFSISFAASGASVRLVPDTLAVGSTCGTGEQILPLPEFFCDAHIVDPAHSPVSGPLAGRPQGEGVACGMALKIGTSFEGDHTFRFGRVTAEVILPAAGAEDELRLYFVDGLQSSNGSPMVNGITSRGKTVSESSGRLTLGEWRMTLVGVPAGSQIPGDINQDASLDLTDCIVLLSHLFLGEPASVPCEGGSILDADNKALLDYDGDGEVAITDAIACYQWYALGGPPHILGRSCIEIPGCPGACSPE